MKKSRRLEISGAVLLASLLALGRNAPAAQVPIQPNSELTLEEAIRITLRLHPQILEARSDTDVAAAQIGEAVSAMLPQVYGSAQNLYNTANSVGTASFLANSVPGGFSRVIERAVNRPGNTFTHSSLSRVQANYFSGLNFSQFLYDFGRVRGFIDERKADFDAAEAKLKFADLNLIFEVSERYFALLAAHELVPVYQQAIDERTEELRQTEAFAKTDLKPKLDVYVIRADLERAKLYLIQAQNAEADAKVALDNAMGLSGEAPPYYQKEQWGYAEITEQLPDLLKTAFRLRPDLKVIHDEVRAAGAQIVQARSDFFPSLYAYGNYQEMGYGGQAGIGISNAPNYAVGFVVNWPIFNGFQTVSQVAEAKYRQRSFEHALDDLEQRVILQVQTTYLNWQASIDEIRRAKATRDASQVQYKLSRERYRNALGNIVDVEVAEQRFVADDAAYINALYAYAVAKAAVEEATGESLVHERIH